MSSPRVAASEATSIVICPDLNISRELERFERGAYELYSTGKDANPFMECKRRKRRCAAPTEDVKIITGSATSLFKSAQRTIGFASSLAITTCSTRLDGS
jgi:hypothetical protein